MADTFLAEIRIFPFNFPPQGWAFCNGQILPISQNTALFSLLGTNYGGNGTSNFGLPNLQGRAALHVGASQGPGLSPYSLGEQDGAQNVTLLSSQIPAHNHNVECTANSGISPTPAGNILAISGTDNTQTMYNNGATGTSLNAASVSPTGSGQPHNNMSPYLALNFCIALTGIFPARS